MPQEEKTFKVRCAHCKKSFHARFPISRSEDTADPLESEVVVNCLHCGEAIIIKIPSDYVEKQHLIMGIDSLPKEG